MALIGTHTEQEYLGGGRYRLIQHPRAVAYWQNGALQRIMPDWSDSNVSERPHMVGAACLQVSVGEDGMRRLHPTGESDRFIELGAPYARVGGQWRQTNLDRPIRQKNLLVWERQNFNCYVWHAGHYCKLGFLLKNGYVPEGNQVAFPVGIHGLSRSGGQILREGVPVARLRAPVVYDWDNTRDVRPIDWQFVSLGGQPYLLLTLPDLSGMAQPLIDPTLDLQPDEDDSFDTYIDHYGVTNNFGISDRLRIGSDGKAMRPLLRWNLASLSETATITSAELVLTTFLSPNSAGYWDVYRQKRPWTELGATWNSYDTGQDWTQAGGFHPDDCEQVAIGSLAYAAVESLGAKHIPLTGTSKSELDLGYGWLLRSRYETDDYVQFRSSNYIVATDRPQLIIEYIEGGEPEHHTLYSIGIDTAQPAFDTVALSQQHVLGTTGLALNSPLLSLPALGQDHGLAADSLTAGAVELGLSELQAYPIIAAHDVETGAPELGLAAISQYHEVPVTALFGGIPALGAPTLIQKQVLAAPAMDVRAPVLGVPQLFSWDDSKVRGIALQGRLRGTPTVTGTLRNKADVEGHYDG